MEKSKNKTHIHSVSLSILLVSSCGAGNLGRGPSSSSLEYSTTEALSTTRELTSDERAIATRICYAYQSKNNSFRTIPYLGSSFTFGINTQDCNDRKNQYNMVSTLIMNEDASVLTYKPSNLSEFYSKVQTNRTGYLTQLCTKIQNNQKISNTIEAVDSTVQINFTKTSGMDSFTIKYFALNASGGYSIKNAEQFMVRTQFNLGAGQILGMDEAYSSFKTCSDAKKYSVFSQSFLNFKAKP